VNIIDRLVELGASVNETANDRWAPLHIASEEGHSNVVDRLVELGASLNEKTTNGWTPLHVASHNGHLDVIMSLLRHSAIASEEFDDEAVFELLESEESLLALSAYGFTQSVTESVLQRLSSHMRDFYLRIRNLCSLQVWFRSMCASFSSLRF
jgi:hypothetical protein